MLSYAYVNGNSKLTYISSQAITFQGTWASGTVYHPPTDVVNYGNAQYISLAPGSNQIPTNAAKWSELVAMAGPPLPVPDFIALRDTATHQVQYLRVTNGQLKISLS